MFVRSINRIDLNKAQQKINFAVKNNLAIAKYRVFESDPMKLIFVGHHKCATQYIKNILRDCAVELGMPIKLNGCDWRGNVKTSDIINNKFICLQNYHEGMLDFSKLSYKGFHVIRDPRDILVSQYYSHRDSHPLTHPLIKEDRDNLIKLSKEDGIDYLISDSRYFEKLMYEIFNWNYKNEFIFESKFEILTTNPVEEFGKIIKFLGIHIEDENLKKIIMKNSFGNLKNSLSSKKLRTNHYRQGKVGDWNNHFSEKNTKQFEEKYGLMIKNLGYF